MKKTMILAAFAALVSLASCQKEEAINNGTDKNASPVFTASIAGATKTTIDLTDGKVAWETTDEITVTDGASASAIYKIESIDATTGKATFAIKTGETALGDGPYTATYGTEPATAQTYSATAGKLYMTAPATSNNGFEFTVQCGLMKLNLTKAGESVKSIAVTSSTDATYTLTCDPAQSIATAKDFYIALPAGSYTKIEITNADDIKCTLNSTNGVAVSANHIKPVTFGESKIKFAPAIPDGALAGKFSVSNDGGTTIEQVHFSQGNLWYGKVGDAQTATFNFEANQYDTTPASDNSWSADHISHFFWSKTASVAYAEGYNDGSASDSDVFFTNETETTSKNDFTVNVGGTEQTGWRTLSTAEWQYLFNDRTDAASKVGYATVGGVNGIIILPDSFTDPKKNNNGSGAFVPKSFTVWDQNVYTSGDNWNAMETAGAVFLPAASDRDGSNVFGVGDKGYYWSSTPSYSDFAYFVSFNSDEVGPDSNDYRGIGYSVRLVTESK